MTKKETAEQKLLRIIEDGGGAASAEGSGAQVAITSNPAQEVAAAVKGTGISLPPVFSMVMEKVQGLSGLLSGKSFGLKQINMLLLALIICAGISLGIFYKNESKILDQAIDFSKNIEPSDMAGSLRILPQYEPLASFLEAILKRNLFRPYEKKPEEIATVPTGEEKIALKVKDLKLVGISWLDVPDSASIMVEKPDGATFFLKTGDTISDVLVKKIFADRVIFSYEDQEMEVRL